MRGRTGSWRREQNRARFRNGDGAEILRFKPICFFDRAYIPSLGLHPAGFLVASSWAMYLLWFSLLIGWAIKVSIMRYGGLLLPFFLGLILGDCLNAIAWTVIGLLTGSGYLLLPKSIAAFRHNAHA